MKDNGIGISDLQQKELFKPFKQLDPDTNRAYEGTGLGVVLVKKFVEMHDGGYVSKASQEKEALSPLQSPSGKDKKRNPSPVSI